MTEEIRGRLAALLERSPFVSAIFDSRGRTVLCSGALRRLLGDRPKAFSDLRSLFGSESAWRTVMDHLWNSGGEWLVAPVADAAGGTHPVSWRSDPLESDHVLLSAVVHTLGPDSGAPMIHGLAEYVADAADGERQDIAEFLHDSLGQELTGLRMLADSLKRRLEGSGDGESAALAGELAELAATSLSQARELSHSLMNIDFSRVHLRSALEDLVSSMSTPEVEVSLDAEYIPRAIPSTTARAAYNIVREALTNAVRHSGSNTVEVRARVVGSDLQLEVRDRGKGFDPRRMGLAGSYGLLLMRQRALAQGLELDIRSEPKRGTSVSCRVPGAAETKGGEDR